MVDFTAHTANIINRLGQPVGITPAVGSPKTVNGVFVNDPAMVFGLVDGNNPTLRLTYQDANGLQNGDPITIGAVAYVVNRIKRDEVAGDVVIDLESV